MTGHLSRAQAEAASLRVARVLGLLVALWAGLVMSGWLWDVPLLRNPYPGSIDMKFNTALALVCLGGALALTATAEAPRWRRHSAKGLSLAVALFGGATLLQYSFAFDLGIDQALVAEPAGAAHTVHLGRASPITAVGFVLLGISLLYERHAPSWLRALPLFVGVAAFLAVFGYVYGVPMLFNPSHYDTGIALTTALLLLVSSVGILAVRPGQGTMAMLTDTGAGGALARRLLPLAVALPLVAEIAVRICTRVGLFDENTGDMSHSLLIAFVMIFVTMRVAYLLAGMDGERTGAENAMKVSEDHLRMILSVSPVGVFETDKAGKCIFINDRCTEITGLSYEASMNDGWADALHPEDRNSVFTAWTTMVVEGARFHKEYRFMRPHGQVTWVVGQIEALRSASGEVFGYVGSVTDITAHKQAELALQESEAKLRGLYELAPLGIALTDMNGRYVEFNEAFRKICGYSSDELMALDYWALTPKKYEAVEALHLDDLKRFGHYGPYEKEYVRKDGSLVPLRLNGTLVSDKYGVDHIWSVVEDITETKRIECELRLSAMVYRAISEAIMVTDADGIIVAVNPAFTELTGYSEAEAAGRRTSLLKSGRQDRDFYREMWASIDETGHWQGEIWNRRKDGGEFLERLTIDTIYGEDGEVQQRVAMFFDVTEHRQIEDTLRISEGRYRGLIESQSDFVIRLDMDGRFVFVNQAFARALGHLPEALIGQPWQSVIHPDDVPITGQAIAKTLSPPEYRATVESRIVQAGAPRWVAWEGSRVSSGEGGRAEVQAVGRDITQRKHSEEMIWKQANFDALTGLPNRRMFHDRLEQEIKKAHRAGQQLAVMFLDLDRFKEVNDTLGHDMGDVLLREAARRLGGCVRETDTLARLGGDEFTVVVGDLDNPGDIERVAQSILRCLSEPFQLGAETVYVSVSIGISLYPSDAGDIESLLKNADQAMYASKQQGRNRFNFFMPAMQEDALKRVRLANDLRDALAAKQFWLAYQPIVDMATGAIGKAEALIRWQHPTRGLVNPAEFIPIAEDTGLIIDIGDWVFREAAYQAKRLWDLGHVNFQISVNKSPVQFHSYNIGPNYHDKWFDHLRELGLSGENIVVEITEGMLMDGSARVTDKLLEFRDGGIQVSLDDFGTGYSSLSYLKKFHIDYLKIDQSFVRNLDPDSDGMALCEAIIVMAHKLGIKVIAEGVETTEQRDLLLGAGCDYGQGYLFSRPVPAAEFEALLERSFSPERV